MKNLTATLLIMLFLTTPVSVNAATIGELLAGDSDLETVLAVLDKTQLLDDLNAAEENLTLLAPTDDAFLAIGLDAALVNALDPTNSFDLDQIIFLRSLLLRHITEGSQSISSLISSSPVEMLQESYLDIVLGTAIPGEPLLIRGNILASNGVADTFLHVIDQSVLFPDGDFSSTESLIVLPSAVPIPAAVWLFGSALIGIIGFGKRNKAI